ncbi:hypothetical protein HPB47_007337 [Ixodes persulcatus]|uniref:Uncharacterized protein n=1 Tax=Ixodes persulcatus TaxID=34615 RepID=A0AC60P7U4_IXOPE|nr:hypothetical protein HPB47_007337 [Ixodes persulcatus]
MWSVHALRALQPKAPWRRPETSSGLEEERSGPSAATALRWTALTYLAFLETQPVARRSSQCLQYRSSEGPCVLCASRRRCVHTRGPAPTKLKHTQHAREGKGVCKLWSWRAGESSRQSRGDFTPRHDTFRQATASRPVTCSMTKPLDAANHVHERSGEEGKASARLDGSGLAASPDSRATPRSKHVDRDVGGPLAADGRTKRPHVESSFTVSPSRAGYTRERSDGPPAAGGSSVSEACSHDAVRGVMWTCLTRPEWRHRWKPDAEASRAAKTSGSTQRRLSLQQLGAAHFLTTDSA